MKKILITILVIAGVAGLVELVRFKPHSTIADPPAVQSQSTAAGDTTTTPPANVNNHYKDGKFTGETVDVGYGPVQIEVTISGGQIIDVSFVQMPSDLEFSRQETAMAEPPLKQETIKAQSAHIDVVTGATQTSQGFIQSLQDALSKAS